MLNELLTRVRAYRSQATSEQADGYKALVVALADGNEPDAEQIAVALDVAGKDESQLQSDVELLIQRRRWAQALKLSDACIDAMRAADKDIEKIRSEMDQVMTKYRAKLDQALREKASAERLVNQHHQAKANLSETFNDARVLAREAEVSQELRQLIEKERELARSISRGEAMIEAIRRNIAGHERDYKANYLPKDRAAAANMIENAKAAARNHRSHLRRLRDEHAEINSQIRELQSEMERLAAQRLVP